MADTSQVVVVDDHPMLREGVALTLAAEPDFEVVGQGGSADDALNLASEFLPDLMLLDVSMPGGGISAVASICQHYPVIKCIMLTVSENEQDVLDAMKAGAKGYILKGVSGSSLINIIRRIQQGEAYVTPSLAAALLKDWQNEEDNSTSIFKELTQREKQILENVATGLSNKEIADKLFLSEKTIKHYMTNILQKLQVRNRVEAALLFYKETN
ncbi:MAG TPA: response regulator transcription factor [Crenotrichaceae bacterium]|nr:response regulator transcription factor [Crenotrichaceae bacterium]